MNNLPNIESLLLETEKRSSDIKQVERFDQINEDIRWFCLDSTSDYSNDKITDYYKVNEYARESRWILWQDTVKIFNKYGIKTNLDIGCANNHFSYLCHSNQIISFGIDPRADIIKSANANFALCGINKRYAYQGSLKTFNEAFIKCDDVLFDCISVINFMHGSNHDENELETFFKIVSKCSRYFFSSLPQKIPVIFSKNFSPICSVKSNSWESKSHFLFKIESA